MWTGVIIEVSDGIGSFEVILKYYEEDGDKENGLTTSIIKSAVFLDSLKWLLNYVTN